MHQMVQTLFTRILEVTQEEDQPKLLGRQQKINTLFGTHQLQVNLNVANPLAKVLHQSIDAIISQLPKEKFIKLLLSVYSTSNGKLGPVRDRE